MDKRIGQYSFVIGVILAIILGLASASLGDPAITYLGSLLVVLGLVVGFLNVTGKETKEFLLVATVLIIAAGLGGTTAGSLLGGVTWVGVYINGIFAQLLAFIIPATIVVALKDILALAQNN